MKGKWIYIGALLFGISLGMAMEGYIIFPIIGFSICSGMMIYDQIKNKGGQINEKLDGK